MSTLNPNSLKDLAIEEFFNLRSLGVIQYMPFDHFIKESNGCLYGYVNKLVTGHCDPNTLTVLKTIQKTCRYLTSNTFEGFGKILPVSYANQFVDNYGRVLVHKEREHSLLVNTEVRILYFLTPLENFLRFPDNEIGEQNTQFVSKLFSMN